jgi:hypothetical protein
MVDMTPPGDITVNSNINTNKLISLNVKSIDEYSGIDKFEVYVGEKKIAETKGISGEEVFIGLPLLKTGLNKITIFAYDYAKNMASKTIDINSPEPEIPQLKILKNKVKVNESNTLFISTYSNTEVIIFTKDEKGNITSRVVKTDNEGVVNVAIESFRSPGVKTFWLSLSNDCAGICVLSEKVTVDVLERNFTQNDVLPWVVASVFLLLFLFSLKRTKNRNIIQELNKAEVDVYKIFKVLKIDAKRYRVMLSRNKIDIPKKDQFIIENLEKDLDEAETYFTKRLEKIEKELE